MTDFAAPHNSPAESMVLRNIRERVYNYHLEREIAKQALFPQVTDWEAHQNREFYFEPNFTLVWDFEKVYLSWRSWEGRSFGLADYGPDTLLLLSQALQRGRDLWAAYLAEHKDELEQEIRELAQRTLDYQQKDCAALRAFLDQPRRPTMIDSAADQKSSKEK